VIPLYNKAIEETVEGSKLLYNLDQKYGHIISGPNFKDDLSNYESVLDKHIKMEEIEILPKLESTYNDDQLESIYRWFESTKNLALTRPHPDGPTSAAGQLTTGPVLKFIYMLRDCTKKLGSEINVDK